jgi:hypothetical protein
MKNMPLLLVLLALQLLGTAKEGHAYFPKDDPYPPVLSPAIDRLPEGSITIIAGDETFYYFKGIFYQKIIRDNEYTVVPPPVGAVVFSIPQGYQYMLIDGMAFYMYRGIFYRRVLEGFEVIFPPI